MSEGVRTVRCSEAIDRNEAYGLFEQPAGRFLAERDKDETSKEGVRWLYKNKEQRAHLTDTSPKSARFGAMAKTPSYPTK
jgi:hypothetical protein